LVICGQYSFLSQDLHVVVRCMLVRCFNQINDRLFVWNLKFSRQCMWYSLVC